MKFWRTPSSRASDVKFSLCFRHAVLSEQDCVIVASDTDVLIILVWAYNHFGIKKNCFLQYETNCYARISTICNFYGEDVCPQVWTYGVVVSMSDFHRSDRGSNPGHGGKMA